MITLKVEDYCHNCPEFEPDVDKNTTEYFESDSMSFMRREKRTVMCETTVTCEHRLRCAAIYECATNKAREKKDERTL